MSSPDRCHLYLGTLRSSQIVQTAQQRLARGNAWRGGNRRCELFSASYCLSCAFVQERVCNRCRSRGDLVTRGRSAGFCVHKDHLGRRGTIHSSSGIATWCWRMTLAAPAGAPLARLDPFVETPALIFNHRTNYAATGNVNLPESYLAQPPDPLLRKTPLPLTLSSQIKPSTTYTESMHTLDGVVSQAYPFQMRIYTLMMHDCCHF